MITKEQINAESLAAKKLWAKEIIMINKVVDKLRETDKSFIEKIEIVPRIEYIDIRMRYKNLNYNICINRESLKFPLSPPPEFFIEKELESAHMEFLRRAFVEYEF